MTDSPLIDTANVKLFHITSTNMVSTREMQFDGGGGGDVMCTLCLKFLVPRKKQEVSGFPGEREWLFKPVCEGYTYRLRTLHMKLM